MKSKNMVLMFVAIGCGLAAAFLTAKLSGGSAPDTVDVIVAKKELPVGTLLDEKELESMLGTQKFPKANLPPDIINNADDLKGKKLNRTLKAGNFFSMGDVGADSGIKLPEGFSKYAIRTDGVKAVAGFVQPGDKVDVILTEVQNNGKAKSGMILREMLVLAVDTRARRTENGEAVLQVQSVCLAVTPKQSLTLSSAEKRGEVKLLLRDPASPDTSNIVATTVIPGFDNKEAPGEPGAAPVKLVTVVVSKGEVAENTQVTAENFEELFITREIPEDAVLSEDQVKDKTQVYGKYLRKHLDPKMPLYASWLSNEKIEPKEVAAKPPEDLEVLPQPKESIQEKPLYPRKFEQIINRQRVFFIEIKEGEFRRVDAGAEIKDLPDSNSKPEPQQKTEEPGDRPI
jgi:pilus assembly protein CpaB